MYDRACVTRLGVPRRVELICRGVLTPDGRSWLPEFDARTFSCEVGVCKPESEIYRDCLKKLGTQPSEVLFLDDREPNVRAAEALGLHAVLFTDPGDASSEIERRFSLPSIPKLAPASNMLPSQ